MAGTLDGPAPDFALAMNLDPIGGADLLIILPLVVPLMAGAILVMLRHHVRHHAAIAAGAMLILVGLDLALLFHVLENGPAVMTMGAWTAPFGIVFEADLLGVTLATTSALIALCVSVFSIPTINTHERRYGFYPFLMLLMTGVTGAFLTGDIFNLYVWFEVLLISSFGLLVLGSEKAQIDGTVKYGILNLMATTLFLIATGYLYGVMGTLNMADIAMKARDLPDDAPMVTIAALYFLAFGMKAAAFPANFWLPASYHTPSAGVSALFAAMLTKVGAYALLKTMVLLLAPQAAMLQEVMIFVAGGTLVVGALGALAQSDLRRMLGFLVIGGIGNIMVGVALPTELGLTGAVFYAVHSMLVMAALYLAAGVIEETAGSGDLRRLGGFYAFNPAFAGLFLVLAFAVAGLPPFSGFWAKAILVDATIEAGASGLTLAILFNGLITSLAMIRVFLFAFWRGGPEGTPDGGTVSGGITWLSDADRGPRLVPIVFLTGLVVIVGLLPAPVYALASGAAATLMDPTAYIDAVFGGTP